MIVPSADRRDRDVAGDGFGRRVARSPVSTAVKNASNWFSGQRHIEELHRHSLSGRGKPSASAVARIRPQTIATPLRAATSGRGQRSIPLPPRDFDQPRMVPPLPKAP